VLEKLDMTSYVFDYAIQWYGPHGSYVRVTTQGQGIEYAYAYSWEIGGHAHAILNSLELFPSDIEARDAGIKMALKHIRRVYEGNLHYDKHEGAFKEAIEFLGVVLHNGSVAIQKELFV